MKAGTEYQSQFWRYVGLAEYAISGQSMTRTREAFTNVRGSANASQFKGMSMDDSWFFARLTWPCKHKSARAQATDPGWGAVSDVFSQAGDGGAGVESAKDLIVKEPEKD